MSSEKTSVDKTEYYLNHFSLFREKIILPSFSPSFDVATVAAVVDVVIGAVANFDASVVVGDAASMTGELSSSSTSLSEAAPGVMKAVRPFEMDVELEKSSVFLLNKLNRQV